MVLVTRPGCSFPSDQSSAWEVIPHCCVFLPRPRSKTDLLVTAAPRVLRYISNLGGSGPTPHFISRHDLQATLGPWWGGVRVHQERGGEAAATNAPSSSCMAVGAGPAIKINPRTALK